MKYLGSFIVSNQLNHVITGKLMHSNGVISLIFNVNIRHFKTLKILKYIYIYIYMKIYILINLFVYIKHTKLLYNYIIAKLVDYSTVQNSVPLCAYYPERCSIDVGV